MISVVVTTYNNEDYIETCVESLLNQTIDNFEIIVVDDSSSDKTYEILCKYGNRIKLTRQPHKGVSSSRNTGVNQANGDYIVFVDGDDYVRKDYLSCLYRQVKPNRLCICSTSYTRDKLETHSLSTVKEISKKQAIKYIFSDRNIGMSVWGKIFSKEILLCNPFPINMFFEDMYILDSCFQCADYFSFSNDKTYYYRRNISGIMNSKLSEKKIYDMRNYNSKILKKYEETELHRYSLIRVLINCVLIIKRSDISFISNLQQELTFVRRNYRSILFSKASLKMKIAVIIAAFAPKLIMGRR